MIRSAALALLCALVALASADDGEEANADRAFRAAEARAVAGDPGALDALEQLGAALPATRWTDDAWLEAGRLAARTGDYARARRDLTAAIAAATDEQLARRARTALARVERAAGANGEWSDVAAAHDRLESRVLAGGDPGPALREMESLVSAHPGYPRAALAMITIATGWERDGDRARALVWLRRAKGIASAADREPVIAALVHTLVRAGALAEARSEIDGLRVEVTRELRAEVARAEGRERLRWIAWAVLGALAVAAGGALRRASGSWRAAMRRVVRPPAEVLYFTPIALVLVVVAATGNPLVASAVRAIAIAGAIVAWLSGAILDAVRARGGRVRLRRAAVHAALAVLAVAGAVYLAIDHDSMIELVIDTWRHGPEMP